MIVGFSLVAGLCVLLGWLCARREPEPPYIPPRFIIWCGECGVRYDRKKHAEKLKKSETWCGCP